jgi:hypothetical protein
MAVGPLRRIDLVVARLLVELCARRLLQRHQSPYLFARLSVAQPVVKGQEESHAPQRGRAKKRGRLARRSLRRNNRMFGSGGSALGFFNREAASDSVEHGHLSLLDRCDGIVDGERRLFVQQLGVIRSAFNSQILLPLGYFRL